MKKFLFAFALLFSVHAMALKEVSTQWEYLTSNEGCEPFGDDDTGCLADLQVTRMSDGEVYYTAVVNTPDSYMMTLSGFIPQGSDDYAQSYWEFSHSWRYIVEGDVTSVTPSIGIKFDDDGYDNSAAFVPELIEK